MKYRSFVRSFETGKKEFHAQAPDLFSLNKRIPLGKSQAAHEMVIGAIHSEHLSADLVWIDCDIPASDLSRLVLTRQTPFDPDRVVLFPSVGGRGHVLLRSSQDLGRIQKTLKSQCPELRIDRIANVQGTPNQAEQMIFSRPLTDSGTLYKDHPAVRALFHCGPHPDFELQAEDSPGEGIAKLARVADWSACVGSGGSTMAPFELARRALAKKAKRLYPGLTDDDAHYIAGEVIISLKNSCEIGLHHTFRGENKNYLIYDVEPVISSKRISKEMGHRRYQLARRVIEHFLPTVHRGSQGRLSIRRVEWARLFEVLGPALAQDFSNLLLGLLDKPNRARKAYQLKNNLDEKAHQSALRLVHHVQTKRHSAILHDVFWYVDLGGSKTSGIVSSNQSETTRQIITSVCTPANQDGKPRKPLTPSRLRQIEADRQRKAELIALAIEITGKTQDSLIREIRQIQKAVRAPQTKNRPSFGRFPKLGTTYLQSLRVQSTFGEKGYEKQ